jgi:hypothetical protein
MRKFWIILPAILLVSFGAIAQRTSLTEVSTESLVLQANEKLVCSHQVGNSLIVASLFPVVNMALVPEQRAGTARIMGLDVTSTPKLKWTFLLTGNVYPADVFTTFQGNYLICGSYTDSIGFGTTKYFTVPGQVKGFVFYLGSNGQLLSFRDYSYAGNIYMHSITQKANTNDTYVALTSNDISSEIAVIGININLDTIRTKRFPEIRTISSISELGGSLYICGTSGDFSQLDAISLNNPLNTGFVNYLAKLDANLTATWAVSRPYYTADLSNHLNVQANGNMIMWGKYEFVSQNNLRQTYDIYTTAGLRKKTYSFIPVGVLNEYNTRITAASIYPGRFNFARRISNNLFLYTIDPDRSLDSIRLFRNSEFQNYSFSGTSNLSLLSSFTSDSLRTSKRSIVNPYKNSNGIQNAITYLSEPFVGIDSKKETEFLVYPNPTSDYLNLPFTTDFEVKVISLDGRVLMQEANTEQLDVRALAPGYYVIEVATARSIGRARFVKK